MIFTAQSRQKTYDFFGLIRLIIWFLSNIQKFKEFHRHFLYVGIYLKEFAITYVLCIEIHLKTNLTSGQSAHKKDYT